MESFKHRWKALPTTVRKPLILIIGSLLVLSSGLLGWLPGPGGIPLFLAGIAVLSTEFAWAHRLREWVLVKIHWLGQWWRSHKILGTLAFIVASAAFITVAVFMYKVALPAIKNQF